MCFVLYSIAGIMRYFVACNRTVDVYLYGLCSHVANFYIFWIVILYCCTHLLRFAFNVGHFVSCDAVVNFTAVYPSLPRFLLCSQG